jgi:hypothetical protein
MTGVATEPTQDYRMMARKWARLRQAGAQGLRRGAWYPVVSESGDSIVVLDVNKRMVPVPRSMLVMSPSRPARWTVVRWDETQRGAQRASESALGLTYVVCPECRLRAALDPPDAAKLTCVQCAREYEVDWSAFG